MRVDRDKMKANLALSRGAIVAEPLYVLLAKGGAAGAHETVRRLTLEAERTGRSVLEVAMHDEDLRQTIGALTPDEPPTKHVSAVASSAEPPPPLRLARPEPEPAPRRVIGTKH